MSMGYFLDVMGGGSPGALIIVLLIPLICIIIFCALAIYIVWQIATNRKEGKNKQNTGPNGEEENRNNKEKGVDI